MWMPAARARLRCRVIYPTGCCVCASVFSRWRAGARTLRYTPAHVSGPVSFVILPYRRVSSLSRRLALFLSPSLTYDTAGTRRARENAMCQPLRVSPHTRERRFCRNTPRWSSTISGIYDDGGATGETWDAVTERKSIETRTRETKRDHSTSLAITRLSPSCRVGSSLPVTPCSFGRARRHSATFGGARLRMAVRGGARRHSAVLGSARRIRPNER